MTSMPRLFIAAALSLFVLHAPAPLANAAIETTSDDATLTMRTQDTPSIIGVGSFSALFYYRPSELPVDERSILDLPGALSIRLNADGTVTTLLTDQTNAQTLSATPSTQLAADAFALIACSFENATGTLTCWVAQDGKPTTDASDTIASFDVGSPADGLTFGATDTLDAAPGLYDILAVRNHTINATDIEDLRANHRDYDIFDLDNLSSGGSFNGQSGCQLLLNHSMMAEPYNIDTNGGGSQDPAIVGQPVTLRAFSVYRSNTSSPRLTASSFLQTVSDMTFRSHYEKSFAGYFVPTQYTPALSAPLSPTVSNKAYQLAHAQPEGLVRVMISANSRSARRTEQLGASPATVVGPPSTGSYIGGFWEHDREMIAGALLIPADNGSRGPWFAFDMYDKAPRRTGPLLHNIGPNGNPESDFARFWTTNGSARGLGPGTGLYLENSARYALKAKPEGLITTDAPLVVEAHVLSFPGSSSLRWSATQEDQQSGGTFSTGSTLGTD